HPAPADPETGRPAVLAAPDLGHLSPPELLAYVQQFMASRYQEGYLKGVHDHDAALLLTALLRLTRTADLLRYPADTRAAASLFWLRFAEPRQRASWERQLHGIGVLLQVFPDSQEFEALKTELQTAVDAFAHQTGLFTPDQVAEAGDYLFHELTHTGAFIISQEAADQYQQFQKSLQERQATALFEQSVAGLQDQPAAQFRLVRQWLAAANPAPQPSPSGRGVPDESFAGTHPSSGGEGPGVGVADGVLETAVLLLTTTYDPARVVHTPLRETLAGFLGSHPRIVTNNENQTTKNEYHLNFPDFRRRLLHYERGLVPQFEEFQETKKQLLAQATEKLRLADFRPRVLTSFVRNRLIDTVYLPLIGANLAKQIGTAGEGKRTDLMGLLLLISPPGYGKTTLLEYVANRLGLVFIKINGPALGHAVTSVDPAQAPNAGARQELEKLNLAFEMGDNVMIYIDDIQHCHPEFLQKFISLCDAQRKIEGVYEGRARTYDFRGRKVCVVMAGNPYTESGDVFQLPDMLANRADIYNLGDILTAGSEEAFRLSYLENALTSNAALARLATQSPQDVPALIRLAETGQQDGLSFEGNHTPEELTEYVAVLEKLLRLRDVVAKVNAAYIASAAQADAYRTEPPFKLQGSYRNMNKLTEKVRPVMNDQEITDLLTAHYES
ncbi:MAG: AAA family ATPase, partial [Hymenobacter sp.]|nr:AAA family ATPase [Hymenobacter sp.]